MHSSRMCTTRSSSRWGEGSLPQCMLGYTPPGCGPGDPPWPDPSTSPMGVGLEPARHTGIPSPPRCGPGDPPGCEPGDPQPDPSTSPLGVDLETCKACWDTTPPPGDLLQGILGYHLQCILGYHTPLWTE